MVFHQYEFEDGESDLSYAVKFFCMIDMDINLSDNFQIKHLSLCLNPPSNLVVQSGHLYMFPLQYYLIFDPEYPPITNMISMIINFLLLFFLVIHKEFNRINC